MKDGILLQWTMGIVCIIISVCHFLSENVYKLCVHKFYVFKGGSGWLFSRNKAQYGTLYKLQRNISLKIKSTIFDVC